MAYNFSTPNLRKVLSAIFNTTNGHDHDGVNSKTVIATKVAAGALSADAAGRAIIEDGYFDAATVATKVAAGALSADAAGRAIIASDYFDEATLTAKIKNGAFTNAVADVKFADGIFAADTVSRAKFSDGIWTLSKLAEEARTHILQIPVEDLGAGEDIAQRFVFEAPTGFDVTLVSANILSQGTPAGIDDSNTCVVLLEDGSSNEIVKSTYNASNAFPSAGVSTSLGTISSTYGVLTAGEKLLLSVTNGASANPPRFVIQIVYTMAAAA